MGHDSMPTYCSSGESVDHNAAAARDVEQALSQLRDLQPTAPDATTHIANAERELRAALRALKE